jgi:enoyl-[acyl-carrier protein] reductase II
MLAAFALGADAVQVGSRFVGSIESSAHSIFKERVLAATEGETRLSLKALTPVRLLENDFARRVLLAENACVSKDELEALLGRGRAKKGMFEGDMIEGELEIGQVSANFDELKSAADIVEELWSEFLREKAKLAAI